MTLYATESSEYIRRQHEQWRAELLFVSNIDLTDI